MEAGKSQCEPSPKWPRSRTTEHAPDPAKCSRLVGAGQGHMRTLQFGPEHTPDGEHPSLSGRPPPESLPSTHRVFPAYFMPLGLGRWGERGGDRDPGFVD